MAVNSCVEDTDSTCKQNATVYAIFLEWQCPSLAGGDAIGGGIDLGSWSEGLKIVPKRRVLLNTLLLVYMYMCV